MNQNKQGYFLLIGFGFLGLAILAGIIMNSIDSANTYRALQNRSKITRVEMKIMDTSAESARNVVLQNDSVCDKVNQSLKYFNEITMEGLRDHSAFVLMDIYKGKRVNIELVRTRSRGWVIDMSGTLYKNDSLIRVLEEYAKLD